jgi:uncharacterized YccA/Bax inhibitor family protein
MQLESNNPVLNSDAFNQYAYREGMAATVSNATISGVVTKSLILINIALVAGCVGYQVAIQSPQAMIAAALTSLVVTLITYFVIHRNPSTALFLAPVYGIVEGFFLGAFTCTLERILEAKGITLVGGLGLQALVVTFSVVIGMLLLYVNRWVRATPTLSKVIMGATAGIMLTYLVSFVLSLMGMHLPFVSLASATATGMSGWIGLGINVLILVVAAFWLVLDFDMIEQRVAAGSTRRMEWYCGFAVLVSVAWIYYESVKILYRLAILTRR